MESGNTGNHDSPNFGGSLPAADDVQRVDAEPMDGGQHYRYGKAAPHYHSGSGGGMGGDPFRRTSGAAMSFLKPPVFATWICLGLAWLFLGSKIPFTVFLGIPFALVSLLLAAVCLSRGGVITGVLVTLLGTVGSFIVYIVGLFRFLARF